MKLLVEIMATANGKRWSLRRDVLQVVGDASERALAAFTPNGELEGRMVVPFTAEERLAVESNNWSSTARELSVLGKILTTIDEQRPGLLRGVRFQYATDSKPALESLVRMKGNRNTFPIVREVRLRAAQLGTELEVIWRPREHHLQQRADEDSKVVDEADWSLHPEVFSQVVNHPALAGREVDLDAFASPTNTKVPNAYFSMFWGPGCKGVDAFSQPWGGRGQLLYINGPFSRLGQVIRKVLEERVDAIIIAPEWPRAWAALWRLLPVRAALPLPHREDLFVPGSLVPSHLAKAKAPRYRVKAYYILWNGPSWGKSK
jgi:hypothetical protein